MVLLLCVLIGEFRFAGVPYLCVRNRELACALCTCWYTLFLTREYKKEHLVLFIWISLSPFLLFESLFILEMCAEDAEGPMLILSKIYSFGMW